MEGNTAGGVIASLWWALLQDARQTNFISAEPPLGPPERLDLSGIRWLIAGGGSGPRHRPMNVEWARDLRDRRVDQKVAFFFRQWGGIRSELAGG